jgi:hypothetical protein
MREGGVGPRKIERKHGRNGLLPLINRREPHVRIELQFRPWSERRKRVHLRFDVRQR